MDAVDRTLLRLLQDDADRTYADLGREVRLSAPATHERVRKLRASGVIRRTTVEIDPAALGATLVAFVLMDTDGWVKEPVVQAVRDDPRVEEVHSIAGDTNFLLKVRVASATELEELLHGLYRVDGVQRTRTSMVLHTYLERPPQVRGSDRPVRPGRPTPG